MDAWWKKETKVLLSLSALYFSKASRPLGYIVSGYINYEKRVRCIQMKFFNYSVLTLYRFFGHSSCSLGLFMSTVCYIASICGIVVMYVIYASKTSCILNIFFISWTAILLVVMMAVSLHSKVCFYYKLASLRIFSRMVKEFFKHFF